MTQTVAILKRFKIQMETKLDRKYTRYAGIRRMGERVAALLGCGIRFLL